MTPSFLTLFEVLEIHRNQVDLYGGTHGIRDQGLLESALAQPVASFDGVFLHETIFDMAAAYLYHICLNHPFLDGNKRVALATALVFLEINGITIEDPSGSLYETVIATATGEISKSELAKRLAALPQAKDS